MKALKLLPIFLILHLAYSCGSSKTAQDEAMEESAPENASNEDKSSGEHFEEFDEVADASTPEEDFKEQPAEKEPEVATSSANSFVDEDEDLFASQNTKSQAPAKEKSVPTVAQSSRPSPALKKVKLTGEMATYNVEEGETLMWVAFKLYGDYRMWKSIAALNKNTLKGKNLVSRGMVIKYNMPNEEFRWKREGNPFLIKKGDTLGLISKDVYGTQKRWKEIWYNNRPMIVNPNSIFAGFTLYFIPDKDKVALQ